LLSSRFHHDVLSTVPSRRESEGGSVGRVASFMVAKDGALVGFMASMVKLLLLLLLVLALLLEGESQLQVEGSL
jgi:hypothetical protein